MSLEIRTADSGQVLRLYVWKNLSIRQPGWYDGKRRASELLHPPLRADLQIAERPSYT